MIQFDSPEALAMALNAAKEAHTLHESRNGPDPDWPTWYAHYMQGWANSGEPVTGYINIYRSGYFHRTGKPLAYDRHAGDIYPTAEAAGKEIHPLSHYVGTIPVQWYESDVPLVNPADSQPIPLARTRNKPQPYTQQDAWAGVVPHYLP